MFPEAFIALKYLRSKKSSRYLSVLSLVSVGGIFVSVFSLFVIHSVMNGFSTHLRRSLVGFNAHIVVDSTGDADMDDKIADWLGDRKEVESLRKVNEFDGIIQTPYGEAAGSKVRGVRHGDIESYTELKTVFFADNSYGKLSGGGNLPGLIVGEELYSRLKLFPGKEEVVTLIFPFGDVGPSGEVEPSRRRFRIIGVFSTGFYEFDARYTIIDKAEAGRLSGIGDVSSHVHVRLESGTDASVFKKILNKNFPKVRISTWEERNRRLFSALKLEKTGMFMLFSIVVFIASFNIFALMTLMSLGKKADMALFYSLGMHLSQMQKIFCFAGFFLGIIGTVAGIFSGFAVLYWLANHPLPLPPAYYLEFLPVRIDPKTVFLLSVMTPAFTVLASIGPAWRVSKMKPMEALRSA